ncbi:RNA polymerase subunit sigma-70 [Dactylosporangium darangshiense]|uniref:RNA polymerase subunit sigma-70 n=1 Tax=Dactylosporangium darangshiense TaxID=579108 RepID=UPI003638EC9E
MTLGGSDPETVVPDSAAFVGATEPFRRELLAHCYRMLGSVDDATDVVQETYLRAWRSYGAFEGRSSVRTWLYQIATNACLTALAHHSRRVLPSGLGGAEQDPAAAPVPAEPGVSWLQPVPDAFLSPDAADPAAVVLAREDLRLALVASLQYLSGAQRAVLILREVLTLPAAEVAVMLGTTTAAVKSTLQRARARLGNWLLRLTTSRSPPSRKLTSFSTSTSRPSRTLTRRLWNGCYAGTPPWRRPRSRPGSPATRPACPISVPMFWDRPVTGSCCRPAPTGSPPRWPTPVIDTAPTGRTE